MYEIQTIWDRSEIERGNVALVDVYNWGGEYRPVTKAVVCYVRNEGFAVRMTCEEQNPRATFTGPNARVCRDSCLEFYVDFFPGMPGGGYMNFEGNALGSMLCCFGPVQPGVWDCPLIGGRAPLLGMGYQHPSPRAFQNEKYWGWELFIPLSMIRQVYGRDDFVPGSRIRGNFYKCGERCNPPHYGSYTAIDLPSPNFMHPEFFADMMITE